MRKPALLFAPAVLAFVVLACEDDPTSNPPPFAFDAGTFDVVVPDVDVPDAPADATPPSVSVTVLRTTGPEAGVRIVAHDAAGAVIDQKLTGADGKATFTGTLPQMVSALLPDEEKLSMEIVTWTSVAPGDDLVVRGVERSFAPVGELAVSFTPPVDADEIRVRMGDCSTGTFGQPPPITLELYSQCVTPTNNAILVMALDAGAVIGYAFKRNVAAPAPDAGPVDHTTGAFGAPEDFTVSATNLPMGGARASLFEIAGSSVHENMTEPLGGDLGERSAVYKRATGYADALVAFAQAGLGIESFIGERFAPGPTSKTFDFEQRLPSVTSVMFDTSNVRRPAVGWTVSSALAPAGAKGGVVMVPFRPFLGADAMHRWYFVVPPTATTVIAPALPPEAEEWLPLADGDSMLFEEEPAVSFVDGTAIPNETAFRRAAGLGVREARYRPQAIAAAGNGAFRVTRHVQPPL